MFKLKWAYEPNKTSGPTCSFSCLNTRVDMFSWMSLPFIYLYFCRDEEYDQGRRKKIRGSKLTFDGTNPFQEIATHKAKTKKAKLDRSSSANQPFRIWWIGSTGLEFVELKRIPRIAAYLHFSVTIVAGQSQRVVEISINQIFLVDIIVLFPHPIM
mgnify:CR=1 FL=1